jgi:anti-sigma factor RsiW
MMRELDHLEAHTLLHPALDGELDTLDIVRFEAHLAGCAECAAEYARLKALSSAIRERATRYEAPAELREALVASLFAVSPRPSGEREGPTAKRWEGEGAASKASLLPIDQPSGATPSPVRSVGAATLSPLGRGFRPRAWLRPAAGGFTVGAALAAGLALLITTSNMNDTVTDSIVTAHIRALQPGHLTDVQISDQHQVKPWFDGKIDFAPPVKELGDQGFDLVGGRLDYIQGREAAVIVYRHKLHMIDLFVTRADQGGSGAASAPSPRTTPSGYNVERWTDGGQDYWAVSDLNRNELGDFAKAWQGR